MILPVTELSLAIGKEGQNVRIAAKLTGYKIDIVSNEEREGNAKAKGEGAKDASKKDKEKDSKKEAG